VTCSNGSMIVTRAMIDYTNVCDDSRMRGAVHKVVYVQANGGITEKLQCLNTYQRRHRRRRLIVLHQEDK
jgi:hypothetical protein